MLKKTVTYTDFNGVSRTEDVYFNLNKAEVLEMELGTTGGLSAMLTTAINSQDTPTLMRIFKNLILKAYGEKSADGKRFVKSEELSSAFSQTEAYSDIFMELATNAVAAAEFVNGIVPKDYQQDPKKIVELVESGANSISDITNAISEQA